MVLDIQTQMSIDYSVARLMVSTVAMVVAKVLTKQPIAVSANLRRFF